MCESLADGGLRCAAHTRPDYEAALAQMGDRAVTPAVYNQMFRDRWELTDEAKTVYEAIAEHASTPQGQKEVAAKFEEIRKVNGQINKFALFLQRARREGEERHAFRKEARAKIKKETTAKKRRENNSMVPLVADPNMTFERSHAAKYPEIAAMWDPEMNDGVTPDQVAPKKNAGVWLRCENGHRFYGRINNYANYWDAGRKPSCPECQPRRQAAFAATQEELTGLAHALGDDPHALNALSPALQYSLLAKMGLMRGGENAMSRNVAMSIVHGDLTFKEALLAEDFDRVEKKIRDNIDDENDLGIIDDADLPTKERRSAAAQVDQVMDAAGTLALVDPDSELAANIMRENVEALWEQAYADPRDLDALTARVNAARGKSEYADALADRFTRELDTVRALPTPPGYQTTRTLPDGTVRTLEPSLAQQRFAALVEDRRRVMNWSGTGAGKTLSATLAVQNTGARETLVVCPKAVVDQWATEFRTGFPDTTEVRLGLPDPANPPPAPPPGINRVWVANYDKFQGDTTGLKAQLAHLNVDAVVFDEIHMAKKSDEAATSRRRAALQEFTDAAGRDNPDLVVIGASATPVVNNLEEARSVLRLVEGPDSKPFPTKPTIKNAAAAHHRIAAAGIRHLPTYDSKLTRTDETIDITGNLHKVQARINHYKQQAGTTRVHPAMMERALLPEKLPALTAKVAANKAAGRGPTVIYTEYTAHMVNPMRKALEERGLRVGVYTGDEDDTTRATVLNDFRDGKIDALIGSRPIATGVDGLQHSCNNLIVASMPWTAAADDQLVGRLQRRGQPRDVEVTYLLTEAKVGRTTWSWCKNNRQKRVRFKRDIANAAVDGVLPDGSLDSQNHGAEAALDGLKELTATLAKQNQNAA